MVQGNGDRASTTSPWRDSSDTNERLDQWLRCPGVLPSSRRYAPRAMFSAAPERLARDRHEQPAVRRARHLGHGVRRVRDVLEDLDRRRHVELAVGERQVLGLHDAVLEVRRLALLPLGLERRVVEVDADDAPVAEAARPTSRRARPRRSRRRGSTAGRPASNSSSSVALEAGHQAPHDRVRRPVLVVGVAGDRAFAVDGDGRAAHTSQGLPFVGLLAVALRRRLRRRPARRSSAAGRSAARRARSARAGLRAGARCGARARRCAGPSSRWPYSRSPMMPSATSDDRRVEQHRAEDQRLHVARAPSPWT